MLLIGTMVQAIGTGLMIPLIMNTMLLLFDEKKRGKIMGTIGLVIMFAPAIGPTLSGVIVDLLGWRWLFFIVIPFMLFTLIFAYKYLSNVGEVTKPRIDILSIVLSTIGVTGIIYGFSESSSAEGGFLNPLTALPIIIGFLSIIVFVLRQRKLKEPILDFSVLKYANYRRGILIFLIVMMSMFASEIVMPMYLQGPMGFSAKVAGFILLPGAILNGLLSPAMGALFDKIGPRKLILPGLFALFGVALFYTKIHPGLSMITFIIAYIVLMVAISAIMMPASTNGLNALPKEKYPHGTAIFNLLQPIGGALGVAIFVGILTALQNHKLQELGSKTKEAANEAMTFGLHGSFFFAAILIAIAIVIASTLTTASNEKSKIKASRKG